MKGFRSEDNQNIFHARDKEEINRYVDDHFTIDKTFALGIPVSILGLISGGIRESFKKQGPDVPLQ
jgi:hypothetical protein